MNACLHVPCDHEARTETRQEDAGQRRLPRALLLTLSLWFVGPVPTWGAEPRPSPANPTAQTMSQGLTVKQPVISSPSSGPLWGGVMEPILSTLRNRRRLLQVGLVGMIAAFYIIMWRK